MFLLASSYGPDLGAGSYLFSLALGIFSLICWWKIFDKAGYPGVGAIIPIYNLYVMAKIAGFSGWSLLIMFIPIVNIIYALVLIVKLCENFGKGMLFALGLIFLSPIFAGILAFDDSVYVG